MAANALLRRLLMLLLLVTLSAYSLPTTTSDDDTQGRNGTILYDRARKRHHYHNHHSVSHHANAQHRHKINKYGGRTVNNKKHAAAIAREKLFEEVEPIDKRFVHLFVRGQDGGEVVDHLYAHPNPYIETGHPYLENENVKGTDLPNMENELPYMEEGDYHDMGDERPYTDSSHLFMDAEHPSIGHGGDKRSNIIIPFQNFVVSDEKTASKIFEATKNSLGSSKRTDAELMQQMYDLEYARQLKLQHQREVDLQRLQDLYIRTTAHQPPLYSLRHSPYIIGSISRPADVGEGFLEGGHFPFRSQSSMEIDRELRERSKLLPILNAYRMLIRTPIKDFIKALHLGREVPFGYG